MTTRSYLLRFIPLATCHIALSVLAFERTWAWFIVPLGVPALTYAHAMGIRLTIGLFTTAAVLTPPDPKPGAPSDAYRSASLEQQAYGIFGIAVLLCLAWVLR